MGLRRLTFEDRESWLAGRMRGIGGSEAAAAVGMSPFSTPLELWKLKIGATEQKDLSGNPAVQRGVRMESAIRGFFEANHPELAVEYHQYDVLFQEERPWLYATLDGELIRENGERGVLEIKTASPNGKLGWAQWADGRMPQHYFLQTLHQLLATGYEFVYLFAALYSVSGDITLREYEFLRSDAKDDMAWLLKRETEFWRMVERGEMPGVPLML